MNKVDCENFNWQQLGYQDGLKGRPANDFDGYHDRVKACAQHGIEANKKLYIDGLTQGLILYCTYESGVLHGDNGDEYAGVCPRSLQEKFLQGYNLGKQRYNLRLREMELDERALELDKRARELQTR